MMYFQVFFFFGDFSTYLHNRFIAQGGTAQGGRGAQEAWIWHFLHRFPNTQHQGSVAERHYNVGVKFLCNRRKTRISNRIETTDGISIMYKGKWGI